jgi:DNA adenine methylase
MKPILKWVGGKSQLLAEIRLVLPTEFGKFFEPFLGGGALFFDLERANSVISDFNPRLVNFYNSVSSSPDAVLREITKIGKMFESLDASGKKNFYYECREKFNGRDASEVNLASLFYFLNKTGFNGLFRENSNGNYNVPFGQKDSFPFPEPVCFARASALLKNATLTHASYETPVMDAQPGDLVYFDPPYVPLEGSPSFTAYLSGGFGPEEQQKLADVFRELAERGVFVVASNSYTDAVKNMYKGFNVVPVKARRNINSNGAKRGVIDEALITSY